MESRVESPAVADQLLVETWAGDHQMERLRVERVDGGAYRLLSVPVFAWGMSRGTIVEARADRHARLHLTRVRHASVGATARCRVSAQTTPRRVHVDHLSNTLSAQLGLGPTSLLEPHLVTVHVADRNDRERATRYLDGLILEGVLLYWEYSDPGTPTEHATLDARVRVWEVEHPVTDPWEEPTAD